MIWHIEEEEAFFSSSLGFGSDRKHPKRRLEHLAGRFLLRQLRSDFPFDKMITGAQGKPELSDKSSYFSISHSFPYAAAIISPKRSVGIDIQMYVEKIGRLQDKFLSVTEQELTRNDIQKITLTWAAKEAVFKYYGLGSVDFKSDMPIQGISWNEHNAEISMLLNKTRELCRLNGFTAKDFAVSWL